MCAFAAVSIACPAQSSTPASKPQTKMTKQQTEELFRSVDDIFAFASKDSHLQKKHDIKREMDSRASVTKLLEKNFKDDESAKRLQRSELVLKKFGLLDRDFNLRPFLISLLTEQIAGFYDAKTHVIHMLDWVAPEEQKPVLAHELTHALQDQHVPMEKWSNVSKTDVSHNAQQDREHIAVDEASTARQSVTEGQGMIVYLDYVLKPQGVTLATAPEIGDRLRSFAETSAAGSPVMSRAPLLLQESLMFPYTDGLYFEYQVQKERGTDAAFAGTLDHPPSTSHEILHPQEYLAHMVPPVLNMPDVHPLLDKEWEPYDVGTLGELDVRITAELFGGKELGEALAPAWAGGIYYAAQRRSATPAEKATPASIGFLYYSEWKNEDSARSFMRMYAGRLGRKYSGVKKVSPEDDQDHQTFNTSEGDVVLTLEDRGVFISEGFDRATAKQLDGLFRGVQGNGPMHTATVSMPRMNEPAMTLSKWMNSFGITHAAMQHARRVAH
ncbi:MAG: hypothetical protein JSS87_04265 [Acidobacteria bacterium]|nr:hypothetical protein [Acidobacteriota bacterium]